jgi:hypothetical protein
MIDWLGGKNRKTEGLASTTDIRTADDDGAIVFQFLRPACFASCLKLWNDWQVGLDFPCRTQIMRKTSVP